MALRLNLLPLAGFVALMIAAVVIDFRRLVIPNGPVVGLCLLWPLRFGSAREVSPVGSLETVAARGGGARGRRDAVFAAA